MTGGLEDPQAYYFHVRILLGVVVGLALTHLLRGVARMVERPRAERMHWVQGCWVVWTFVYLLHFWWFQLQLANGEILTIAHMSFLVLYGLLIYLIAALLMPEDIGDYHNYADYRQRRGPWFFALLALMFLVDLYDTWIKGADHFASLGTEYPLRNGAYICLSLVAIRNRSIGFQSVFAVAALVYEFSWIARLYGAGSG